MSKINKSDVLLERLEVPYKVGDKVYYTVMYPICKNSYTDCDCSIREAVVTGINKDFVQLSSTSSELHYSVRPVNKEDICQLTIPSEGIMYMVSIDKQVVAAMLAQFINIDVLAKESQLKYLQNDIKRLKASYNMLLKEYNLTKEDARL